MRKRVIQILGFLLSTLGWFFVSCTLAMDRWRLTKLGGLGGSFVVKVVWYWSNLWKDCYEDSTAVINCRDYAMLWYQTPYIQGVRGLLIGGLVLGFSAGVLAFLGMECTYIGGTEKTNDRLLLVAAAFHFVGGVADIGGYCLFINRISQTLFNPDLNQNVLRYNIGAPIIVGLVGSFLVILGSILYAVTVLFPKRAVYAYTSRSYVTPRTRSRTLYTRQYIPSRPSRQSAELSTVSQITDVKMSERDAFV